MLKSIVRWIAGIALAALSSLAAAAAVSVFTTETPAGGFVSVPATNGFDGVPYEMGMRFHSSVNGYITAIRFFRADDEPFADGVHTGRIWSSAGAILASVAFQNESPADGWQVQALGSALAISANTTYTVSVNSSYYAYTFQGLVNPVTNGVLSSIGSSVANGAGSGITVNGVFGDPGTYPNNSFNSNNYFRDIVFVAESEFGPFSEVPLPAGLPLLLSGLLAVGAGTIRRSAVTA